MNMKMRKTLVWKTLIFGCQMLCLSFQDMFEKKSRFCYVGGLGALGFFISGMNTLCNKTIDDTLLTVKHYEAARYVTCYFTIVFSTVFWCFY